MPSEKTLKTIVIVLGIILVVGFAIIVGTIIKRATELDDGVRIPSQAESDGNQAYGSGVARLATPEGAELVEISVIRKTIFVTVITPEGERRELIFDGETGELIGELFRGEMDEDLPDTSEQN